MKKKLFVTFCLVVMMTLIVSSASAHTHVWGPWKWSKQPTCMAEGEQVRTCTLSGCGMHDRRKVAKMPHDYAAATCTKAATCKYGCGATSGSPLGHSYRSATCVSPKTCIRCGATTGGLGSHNFAAATCKRPSTCTVCGATTGSLGSHNFVNGRCIVCGCMEDQINSEPGMPELIGQLPMITY